jgi:hypothetical protein
MKKYFFLIYIGLTSLLLNSCIKEDIKSFQGNTVAEIDAAVLNPATAGTTYPILTRIPFAGRPVLTADSTLRRLNNTTIRIRINLVGPQSGKDETVGFTTFTTSPVTTIAFGATATGQTPSAPATTTASPLSLLSAVANTHYVVASSGTVTIPAKSSFGYIDVVIVNSGPTAGQARFLGIEINNAGTIPANPNYSKIGLAIDQR